MQAILRIAENSLAAVVTIAVLLLAVYVVLTVLEWGLRIKSRGREQEGLTELWSDVHKQAESMNGDPADPDQEEIQ